jgi:hypothetical protein
MNPGPPRALVLNVNKRPGCTNYRPTGPNSIPWHETCNKLRNAMTHAGGILDSAVLGWLVAVVVLATSVITTILVLWALRVRRRLDQVKPGENPQDDAATRLTRAPDPPNGG